MRLKIWYKHYDSCGNSVTRTKEVTFTKNMLLLVGYNNGNESINIAIDNKIVWSMLMTGNVESNTITRIDISTNSIHDLINVLQQIQHFLDDVKISISMEEEQNNK